MSEDKQADNDPENTLVTLEQLSQTIEVMSSVVNRLRQHLSEQLQAREDCKRLAGEAASAEAGAEATPETRQAVDTTAPNGQKKESFVVEIRQQESEPTRKNSKTLH